MWSNGMGWGGWLLMALTAAGFWALVVVGIMALFRSTDGSGRRGGTRPEEAHRILDERLARGEIDVEEYRTRRAVLAAPR